jgi:thiol-disulfide isomerase/thioredoxin
MWINKMKMPVLFLAKSCEYCKELLSIVEGTGDIIMKLDVVYVEDMRSNLPKFVDRVPLLLLQEEGILLHDEQLFDYIKSKENVLGFVSGEMGGSLSDTYSFMEDEISSKLPKTLDHHFSFLENGEPKITDVEKENSAESKKIVSYDAYLEDRDRDMAQIFQKQSPCQN